MWWLTLVGLIFIGTAVYMLMSPAQKRATQTFTAHSIQALPAWSNMDKDDLMLPQRWDENLITRQLTDLRDRPPALSHYVSSVMDRFVLRQTDQTAKVRSQFLRTQIDQLKLAKEFHTALDDLTLHQIERDIRQRGLEIERQDLDNKQQQQQELTALQHQQEKLRVQLEIARLSRQIKEEEIPPPLPVSNPVDERAQKRSFHEAEIARKREAKARAVDQAPTEEDKARVANMYDDSIEREMAELSKFL
jgi:hypothetical protein